MRFAHAEILTLITNLDGINYETNLLINSYIEPYSIEQLGDILVV